MYNTKTASRIAAIQTLYQYFYEDTKQDLDNLINNMINLYKKNDLYNDEDNNFSNSNKTRSIKINVNYYKLLIVETVKNIIFIDKIISYNLDEDKQLDQLEPLLLAILRVAIGELEYFKNTPKNVVISEFTNIASEMLNLPETGFINFILDKITKDQKNV